MDESANDVCRYCANGYLRLASSQRNPDLKLRGITEGVISAVANLLVQSIKCTGE